MKSIEVCGKNVDQAIEIGLFKMEAKREDVKVIVLDDGGLFSKAKVKLVLNSEFENQSEVEKFVSDFISNINLNVFAEVQEEDDKITINLSGSDIGILIGKRGDVLDAMQYLFSQILNKGKTGDDFKRVLIDSEGYRGKREDTLKILAVRLANKASKEGKTVKLESMSASERRIIHTTLQDRTDVQTLSKGEEPNRYITIIPVGSDKRKDRKTISQMQSFKPSDKKSNRDFND